MAVTIFYLTVRGNRSTQALKKCVEVPHVIGKDGIVCNMGNTQAIQQLGLSMFPFCAGISENTKLSHVVVKFLVLFSLSMVIQKESSSQFRLSAGPPV